MNRYKKQSTLICHSRYYVNNHYIDPEMNENPPQVADISKIQRNILADKPRVTRFPIDWGNGGESKGSQSLSLGNENAAPQMDLPQGLSDDYLMQASSALDGGDTDLVIGGEDDDLVPYADEDEEEEDDEEENEMDVDEIDLMDDL